jgi:hypothetical protein
MKVKEYSEFIIDCNKGYCNRQTIYNNKICKTESKQKSCFPKYLTKLEKEQNKFIEKIQKDQDKLQEAIDNNFIDSIDLKWDEVKKEVWKRDTNFIFTGTYKLPNWQDYCVIWQNILAYKEKHFIMYHFIEDLSSSYMLSNLHIESRQRKPELKYDINNIILAGNYFHELFDNYLDLVTREKMDNDRRNFWILRFKRYIQSKGEKNAL